MHSTVNLPIKPRGVSCAIAVIIAAPRQWPVQVEMNGDPVASTVEMLGLHPSLRQTQRFQLDQSKNSTQITLLDTTWIV
jgi:hypothetical protein